MTNRTNHLLNRTEALRRISSGEVWDMIVIGGGATGLGVAVDAASRGFQTLLLEQADFAKGTSSRSTKLVHGGVRYLAQGRIGLVFRALRERGILLKNASHIVKKQEFIIPCYNQWQKWKYLIGLKIYDWLSGNLSFGDSEWLNKKKLIVLLSGIKQDGLVGGVRYFDGQFDDARLAINLAQTCVEQGGVVINYCKVGSFLKKDEKVSGVVATDMETKADYTLKAKVVINATGVFVDHILQMDAPERKPLIHSSQGVHLVFDQSFLPGKSALLIPKTSDGRVLFAVPWKNHVLVGTTDTPIEKHSLEPVALEEEIDFIFQTITQYFTKKPSREDVLSVYAGLRPLVAPQKEAGDTKEISRDLKLMVSSSGLITITGGKWTTYRHMSEVTVNKAIEVAGLKRIASITKNLPIHGCITDSDESHLAIYGTDEKEVKDLMKLNPDLESRLIQNLPYTRAEMVWAVRNEMALTVEDILARRIRMLFLDARAAISAAPEVARILAVELDKDEQWQQQQVEEFTSLAGNYILK